MFWVSVIVYNYGRLTTVVIWIFSFSSMFVITFEFYMVISDISSCFFDRCFLHQSAPTEAWRITLSNPTKTWSLGSNQVPLYLHKLLLGMGFWGGGVHYLQGIVFNSAKNQWYVSILKSLWGVWWGVHCLQNIVFNSAKNQRYVYIHKSLGGGGVHCLQYMVYNSAKNRVWVQTSDMSLLCLYS